MADILIRDLDDATKRRLKEQALRHGRSQQGEARAILQASLQDSGSTGWVGRLRNAAQAAGGIDLEEPIRHPAREIDVRGWL
ncbi:FitA-like ribbon-helix-helix domain-containing protein [Adlercreutzia muris]|jgi:plasmid stability protein|uniref:FitA-like ribbon-helix-helix domain-containing protein n=1 Tax=Adlercreutzia muris TaxID=1796610 RepID=UPI00109450C4|nr:TraY domain-containing protein [Enterorhabdus sp. NM05_H27]